MMAAIYVLVYILSLSVNPYVEEEATKPEKFNTEKNNNEELVRDEKTGISLYCSQRVCGAFLLTLLL